jgi:hypothetical protein
MEINAWDHINRLSQTHEPETFCLGDREFDDNVVGFEVFVEDQPFARGGTATLPVGAEPIDIDEAMVAGLEQFVFKFPAMGYIALHIRRWGAGGGL